MARFLLFIAALLGASGVAIGAYAAHGLEPALRDKGLGEELVAERLDQCNVGVRYHLLHSVAILAVAISAFSNRRLFHVAAVLWLLGVMLFSGGLYSIVFHGYNAHWIVPIGGGAFILGWLVLALASIASTRVAASA